MTRRRRGDCDTCRIGCDHCDELACECADYRPNWLDRLLDRLLHRLTHFRRRAP